MQHRSQCQFIITSSYPAASCLPRLPPAVHVSLPSHSYGSRSRSCPSHEGDRVDAHARMCGTREQSRRRTYGQIPIPARAVKPHGPALVGLPTQTSSRPMSDQADRNRRSETPGVATRTCESSSRCRTVRITGGKRRLVHLPYDHR